MSVQQAVIAVTVLCLIAAGYCDGYSRAKDKGRIALQELQAEYAAERLRDSEAHGLKIRDVLDKYEAEVARGNTLGKDLLEEKAAHAKTAGRLQRKINEVTRGSTHTFRPDFVRMLNNAAGVPDAAGTEALCAAGTDDAAGACGAAGPGVLEPFSGVTEADLLAWGVDYAERCRGLETQVTGWRRLALQSGWVPPAEEEIQK